jgi:hypothetical protein
MRGFKFEARWLKDPEFLKLIRDEWDEGGRCVGWFHAGYPMQVIGMPKETVVLQPSEVWESR